MELLIQKKKQLVSGKFSEMGAGTEKEQFGLAYTHKIQSRNPIKYLIIIL